LVRLQRTKDVYGEVLNVGSTQEISILDLARCVISAVNSTSHVVFVSYEKAYAKGFQDMLRRKPIIDKLAKTIGFGPATSIEEIVRLTAAAF
jgi:UDP-glucose 4-epimerase